MEKTYTMQEISEQLGGIPVDDIIKLGFEEGILNEDGTPTEMGYEMGLFVDNREKDNKIHTVVMSKSNDETYLFAELGVILDKENFIIEATNILESGDEINLVRSVEFFEDTESFLKYLSEK